MPLPSARVAKDAVLARLSTVASLGVHEGPVRTAPALDPDGRVHPYAVLWAGAGQTAAPRLTRDPGGRDWTFQVTCVGGDQNRALWAADKVTGVLVAWRPTATAGLVDTDGDPGPVREDATPDAPPRYFVPLTFRVLLT